MIPGGLLVRMGFRARALVWWVEKRSRLVREFMSGWERWAPQAPTVREIVEWEFGPGDFGI